MIANGIRPNVYTYTILLNFWSYCKYPQATSRIEQMYDRLCNEDMFRWDDRAFETLLIALKKVSMIRSFKPNNSQNRNQRHMIDNEDDNVQGNTANVRSVPLKQRKTYTTDDNDSNDSSDYLTKAEDLLYICLQAGWVPDNAVWVRLLTTDINYPHSYTRMLRVYTALGNANIKPSVDILVAMLSVLVAVTRYEDNAIVIAHALVKKIMESFATNQKSNNVTSLPAFKPIRSLYDNIMANSCIDDKKKKNYIIEN